MEEKLKAEEEKYVVPVSMRGILSVCYHNRAATYAQIEGREDNVIQDCNKAIEYDEKYTKAYIRRAKAYESTDKKEEALKGNLFQN